MPKKIYIVDLTEEERTQLLEFIKSGKQSARKLNRARILLLADEGKADSEIAEALHTGTATVQRTRRRFVEGNLEGALNERRRPGGQKKLDEKGEAILETLAHSKPPEGRYLVQACTNFIFSDNRITCTANSFSIQRFFAIVSFL